MGSLRLDKLFHVLVVLGAASCGEDDSTRRDRDVDATVSSDGDGGVSGDGATSPDATAEGNPCFCDTSACCDRSQDPPVVQDGFVCCWSTVCD